MEQHLIRFKANMLSPFIAQGKIDIATLPNQDPLEASTGLKPLLGIDVWEVRPDSCNVQSLVL